MSTRDDPEGVPLPGATRRSFLTRSALAAAALGLGCDRRPRAVEATIDLGLSPGAEATASTPEVEAPRSSSADWEPFPVIEAAGPPEELGASIGRQTAGQIRQCLEADREHLEALRAFALDARAARLDPFLQATERHHPEVMAELRGLARGAGLPLEDILIWNLQPELGTMRSLEPPAPPGCSTFHLVAGDRVILAHNEDGADLFRRQMLILRLRPEGKPAFTSLGYPGQIPGQVPAWNSAGLMVSTNFIAAREVRPGIPRYVLGRAVHGCSTLDQAITVATHPDRAFAFTLNLGHQTERRLVCLEVAPRVHDLREGAGLFVHTNHLVLPATLDVPQSAGGPEGSSGSRYQVLTRAAEALGPPESVTADQLLALLASHDAVTQPYSPCRHPDGRSTGRTLATALLDVGAGTFTLYEGNPCEGRRRELRCC